MELKNTQFNDEDYEQAIRVRNKFEFKAFRDYHDIYLESGVLLLADIFQEFRIQTQKNIGIDPLHYICLLSMAFDGDVKIVTDSCEPQINLVTDLDMYMMFERVTWGAVSQISNRYAKANNPYLEGYDASKPTSYIMHVDANNIYECSMMENLPVSHFKWCNPSIEEILASD